MLIGIDASRANNLQKSGVEWYAYHLIKNLYQIDSKNQYFLYSDSKLTSDLKPLLPNFRERVLRWPFNRFWTLGRMSLEMIFKRPDLLFVPAHTLPLIGAKKNVVTWHDVGYERYPETYSRWELTSLKQGAKRAVRKADLIITISQFTKEEMLKFYKIEPEKIKVIYLGCNHDRWQPQSAEAIKQFQQENNLGLPYFVYLGRLTLRKNIIDLIRIYNRFREKNKTPHQLILVGQAAPWQNEINEEIQVSPYKNEIKKMGWLPLAQLPFLLSGAQGLVFPSFYEGFGLPVIEAMACGCPVIASSSGALPEIVASGGLLVDAHDIEGFAQKMVAVITDQNLRQDLIKRGLARSQEFSWEKCARETLEVLETI